MMKSSGWKWGRWKPSLTASFLQILLQICRVPACLRGWHLQKHSRMFLAVSQTLGSWLPLYPTFTHMICDLSPSYRKGGREMNGDLAAYSFGRVSDICVMLLSSLHRYNLLLLTWTYHEISQNNELTLPITGSYYEALWCLSGKVTSTWFLEQSVSRISKLLHMKTHTCSQG